MGEHAKYHQKSAFLKILYDIYIYENLLKSQVAFKLSSSNFIHKGCLNFIFFLIMLILQKYNFFSSNYINNKIMHRTKTEL